jgi:hypothetical protein
MINTEQIFKELITFIEKLEIEELQFIDDETSESIKFVTASLNGLHTENAIEVVIDCFFQRGFTNFKHQAKRILREDGVQKLSSTMTYMAGELSTIFKKGKIKSVLQDPISFSDMQSQMNSQNYLEWKSAVKEGVATPVLLSALNSAVEKVISNFPDRSKELVREFSSELNKIEFLVDKEFMRVHGLDLYNALVDSGELRANFDDFQSMCRGEMPIEKVKFKKASSLGMFIKELDSLSLIKIKRNYWDFLANKACEEFSKEFKVEHLRSNLQASKNPNVSRVFEKIRHKFK